MKTNLMRQAELILVHVAKTFLRSLASPNRTAATILNYRPGRPWGVLTNFIFRIVVKYLC